jgi:flagellar hook-length control protein FliK
MDTAASMINAGPAPASSAPLTGSAPTVVADGPGRGRSFAATLADERPGAARGPASPDGPSANAESTSEAGAPPAAEPAPKDTKAPARPAARPRAATGGDRSPADGNALPLWLPPAVQASALLASATAGSQSAPDNTSAVTAADAPRAAARAAERAPVEAALEGQHQQEQAPGPVEPAAPEQAATAPHLSAQAAAFASSTEAAFAKAAVALQQVQEQSGGPPAADDASRKAAAAADAARPLAASSPAPEPAAQSAAAASDALAVATTIAIVPATKASRSPTAAGDTRPPVAPAADIAPALPPVAPDLEHAVAAVRSAGPKSEVAAMPAPAKAAADATAGVLPQTSGAAPERAPPPTVVQVSTPVGAPAWARELADRVNVLVNQNLTHAQIKLSPADLGPIEVRIALSDGQANVSFTTHSHLTSEALQATAPQLREALQSQGYSSVSVDVAQQQFRERTPQQTRYEPEPAFAAAPPRGAMRTGPRVAGVASTALRLDAYA